MLSRIFLPVALLLAVVGITLVGQQPPAVPAPAPATKQPPPAKTAEEEIARGLEQPVSLDVTQKPLEEVLAELGAKAGVRIRLHGAALNSVGIKAESPVTQQVSDMPLKSLLRYLLRELELDYVVRDEVLLITTPEEANAHLVTRVYPVPDLVEQDLQIDGQEPVPDFDSLIDLITSSTSPTSWDDVGGPGSIEGLGTSLVVSQTPAVHEEIEPLLAVLRRGREMWKKWAGKTRPEILTASPSLPSSGSAEEARIHRALLEKTHWDKSDTSLTKLMAELAQRHKIRIFFDRKALADVGVRVDTPLADKTEGVSLQAGLRRLLREFGLEYVIRDDALLITSVDAAAMRPTPRAYPIFDLVEESFGAPLSMTRPVFGGSPIPVVGSVERGQNSPLLQIASGGRVGPFLPNPVIPRHPDLENSPITDVDSLHSLVTSTIAPTTWEEVGGPSSIDHYAPSRVLIISTFDEVHTEIQALLTRLREVTNVANKMTQERLDDYDSKVIPVVFLVAADSAERPMPDAKEVAEAIRATVAPEIWNQPGNSLVTLRGRIRVVAPRKTQRAIDKLLRELGVLSPIPSTTAPPGLGGGGGGFGGGGFAM